MHMPVTGIREPLVRGHQGSQSKLPRRGSILRQLQDLLGSRGTSIVPIYIPVQLKRMCLC